MRASEFINEAKIGKIGKRKQFATRGLLKFRDANFADRIYELNRIGMAAACTDGTTLPMMDGESWAGRHDIAAPYTKEEQAMMMQAFKAVGSQYQDINLGDLRSQELPNVNTTSPFKPFKGYKK